MSSSQRDRNSEHIFHNDNSKKWCKFHRMEDHLLGDYYDFEASVHEDKKYFPMLKGLCFRCSGIRTTRDCKEKLACTICSRNDHVKIMHRSNENLRSQNDTARNHTKHPVTLCTNSHDPNEMSEPLCS